MRLHPVGCESLSAHLFSPESGIPLARGRFVKSGNGVFHSGGRNQSVCNDIVPCIDHARVSRGSDAHPIVRRSEGTGARLLLVSGRENEERRR